MKLYTYSIIPDYPKLHYTTIIMMKLHVLLYMNQCIVIHVRGVKLYQNV